jgi:tetratricopeptide (TPR) repeat protein
MKKKKQKKRDAAAEPQRAGVPYGFLLLAAIPLAVALAANADVLQNGFGWDDRLIIQNMKLPEHWWSVLFPGAGHAAKAAAPYYRPMVSLSYMLDLTLWGDGPFGFHFSLWLLHGLNALLVFLLAARWMAIGRTQGSAPTTVAGRNPLRPHGIVPLIAALLFAVHPIHAEAVAWIAGRNDVLCAAFLLGSLLAYTRASRIAFYILSMFLFLCALLTKEAAVFAFILYPMYDYLKAGAASSAPTPQLRLTSILSRSIPPVLIVGLYFLMRSARITHVAGGASAGTLASGSAVAKAIAAAGLYFKLLVWPYPHHPFIAKVPDAAPLLMLSAVALIGVLIGWGFALLRGRRLVVMAIGLMLATLGPALLVNVLRVAATPAAERYVYLPSAGFVMLAGWAAGWAWERLPAGAIRIAAVGLAVALIGLWGWQSRERNRVWHDLVSFWTAAVADAPNAGFPAGQLGVQMERGGKPDRAETLFRSAISLDEASLGPDHPFVAINLLNLADLYVDEGRFPDAEPLYRRAIAIREKALGPGHPELAIALNNLGAMYRLQGRYSEAESLYRRALAIRETSLGKNHPAVFTSLNNLAVLYHVQGRYEKAEDYYRRALGVAKHAVRPDDPNLLKTLESYGNLLRRMNRDADAERIDQRIEAIRGKNRPAKPVTKEPETRPDG